MISIGYYLSHANLGLLVMTGIDSLLLIAFIVCAVTLGKPLSYLNCHIIGKWSRGVDIQYANTFVTAATNNPNAIGSSLNLLYWSSVTKSSCSQAKTCLLYTSDAADE